MHTEMINSLSFSAINHLLTQSDWARKRLQPHAGRTAQIDLSPIKTLGFSISSEGYLAEWIVDENTGLEADVTIRLSPGDLHHILRGGTETLMRHVHLEGNAEFADTLGFIARHLKWDAAEDLSHFTGDIIAQRLVSTGRSLAALPHQLLTSISGNLAEYLIQEKSLIVTQANTNAFNRDVAILRDAVARLEKRSARLNHR